MPVNSINVKNRLQKLIYLALYTNQCVNLLPQLPQYRHLDKSAFNKRVIFKA